LGFSFISLRLLLSNARDRTAADALRLLQQEACDPSPLLKGMAVFRQGERLYARPGCAPDLNGIKVITPGLWLARIGRSHVEPAHALAMALPVDCALRHVDLSDDEAGAWLRGEAVPCDGEKGWTLALYRGMPLGWGKVSDGMLKNHLPKGLRRF